MGPSGTILIWGPSLSGASGRENPTGFGLPQSAFPCVTQVFVRSLWATFPDEVGSQPPPHMLPPTDRPRSRANGGTRNGGTRTRAPARILAPAARMRRSHRRPAPCSFLRVPPMLRAPCPCAPLVRATLATARGGPLSSRLPHILLLCRLYTL